MTKALEDYKWLKLSSIFGLVIWNAYLLMGFGGTTQSDDFGRTDVWLRELILFSILFHCPLFFILVLQIQALQYHRMVNTLVQLFQPFAALSIFFSVSVGVSMKGTIGTAIAAGVWMIYSGLVCYMGLSQLVQIYKDKMRVHKYNICLSLSLVYLFGGGIYFFISRLPGLRKEHELIALYNSYHMQASFALSMVAGVSLFKLKTHSKALSDLNVLHGENWDCSQTFSDYSKVQTLIVGGIILETICDVLANSVTEIFKFVASIVNVVTQLSLSFLLLFVIVPMLNNKKGTQILLATAAIALSASTLFTFIWEVIKASGHDASSIDAALLVDGWIVAIGFSTPGIFAWMMQLHSERRKILIV